MKHLTDYTKPGVTTAELDKLAEDLIIANGAVPSFKGYKGYPFTTCTSVNEQVVHGFPSERVLENGDIIGIDVGAYLDGFHADSAVTIPVGVISSESQQIIDVTKDALNTAIDNLYPGKHLGDISEAIQNKAESNGYNVVRDLFGHGIGRELHEEPHIPNFGVKGTGLIIEEGMVFAIEPMLVLGSYNLDLLEDGWTVITRDRKISAHQEHTVAITKDGSLILT